MPAGVDAEIAAAAVMQGLTAHFLTHDTYPAARRPPLPDPRGRRRCRAAGSCSWPRRAAREVFATVGSPEKAELARAAGADHVIDYRAEDFGDAVEAIAGPRALDVVYDGVGRATFARGLDLLRPRGMMVTFGNASGPVEPVAPLTLMQKGSLFLTRPTLHDYVATTRGAARPRGRPLRGWSRPAARRPDRRAAPPGARPRRPTACWSRRTTTGKLLLIP